MSPLCPEDAVLRGRLQASFCFGPAVSRDRYSASLVSLLPNSALSGYPGQISMCESWISIWTPKMLYNLHRQAVLGRPYDKTGVPRGWHRDGPVPGKGE